MTTTSRPNVLVLMACYNGRKWLEEQLNSILLQTDVNVTIVARDDGSSDGTDRLLKNVSASKPEINLLISKQRSGSAASNFATLIQSTPSLGYEYVALSDQDDIWFTEKLRRAIASLKNSDAAGYSSATIASWSSGKTRTISLNPNFTANDFLLEGAGQGCTFVLKSEFYERLRSFVSTHSELFSTAHYHDWAIYALARTWHLPWSFDSTPSLIYRQHDTNDTGSRGSARAAIKRIALIRNGWYKSQLHAISNICLRASPADAQLRHWHHLIAQDRNPSRKIRLMLLCAKNGRRKRFDNLIVLCSIALGWI